MNSRKHLILLLLLLTMSFGNVQQIAGQQSTTLETGDNFRYTINGDEYRESYNFWREYNASNPSDSYWIEERGDEEYILLDGDANLFIVRSRSTLPPIDTMPLIDVRIQTLAGSYASGYNNRSEDGMGWTNDTYGPDDLSGREMREDQRPENMPSNSTYSLIFHEMVANNFDFGNELNFEYITHSFDGNIPLQSRTVETISGMTFNINGASHAIDTIKVNSTFGVLYEENITGSIPWGDPNDPDTPFVDFNGTIMFEFNFNYIHYFDATNGIMLGFEQYHSNTVESGIWNENATVTFSDGGEYNFGFESFNYHHNDNSQTIMIDQASSFYGNTRPTSSGENRIEEGDILGYDFGEESHSSLNVHFEEGDYAFRDESRWFDSTTEGELLFDIFRHQPGSFQALVIGDGTSTGEFGYSVQENYNGSTYEDGDTIPFGPEPSFFIDQFMGASSSSEEIVHFFDDSMWINDNLFCEGPDCEDEYRPDYPRMVPQSGPVNETSFYINLVEDGEGPILINGFEHYEFNVHGFIQDYILSTSGQIMVPIGGGDGDIWVEADFTVNADGEIGFYYDEDTGALIRMEQRLDARINIFGDWTVDINGVLTPISLDATIDTSSRFYIMLNQHPHLYQEQPTSPVDGPDDGGDANDTDSVGLDLPLPVGPVLASITFTGIIATYRRRN